MDSITRAQLDNLNAQDGDLRYAALLYLLKVTEARVDWAYEVWDELVADLDHADNHRRAIAAQLLCNLARSDPQDRMLKDFEALLQVTRDERFVTARHCLQAIWKVGAAGQKQQQMLLDALAGRFEECAAEKNCALIRYDIIQGLRKLYDEAPAGQIKQKALELVESVEDGKYRKKYAGLWKIK